MVFDIALSGIQAASSDLEVTGNNIANANTIGFKKSRTEFGDVYASGTQNAIGSGVSLLNVRQNFTQGNKTTTSNTLDLAIEGGGFFMLSDGGAVSYTRAGAFKVNKDGFVVNSLEQRLQGFQADNNGNISPIAGDLMIDTANINPMATTALSQGFNLSSSATPPSVDWVGGATPATDSYNNVTSSRIYDSLGNSHTLSMYFIKADASAVLGAPNASTPPGTDNQWYVALQLDGQNVPANVGPNNTDNLYRVNFNSDGSFAAALDTSNTPLAGNQIPINHNFGNGSDPLAMTVDISNTTQFGSDFNKLPVSQNGFTTGKLASLDIGADGIILGSYSNGRSRAIGQVLLANFASPEGLQPRGNTSWLETSDSGQPLIGEPGSSGLGSISSGRLEQSNTDLTASLIDLINAQRNFQANAQTIRTGDAITQTIINIR